MNVLWPTCDPLSESFVSAAALEGYDASRWIPVIEWRHLPSGNQGWVEPPGRCGYLAPAVMEAIKSNGSALETRCAVYEADDSGTLGNRSSREEWSYGGMGALIAASPATKDFDTFTYEECNAACGNCERAQ